MRPTRKSIFENLSPEQQVLWDVFNLDAVYCAKISVTRSRRRPGEWVRARYEDRIGRAPAELLEAIRIQNEAQADTESPDLAPFEWQSPAQLGRRQTLKERGPNSDGPGWKQRTREAQRRINIREEKIRNAKTGNEMFKAIYDVERIESLVYDSPLLQMLSRRSK